MSSHVPYYFAAYAVILTLYMFLPVNGQNTIIQGCENGDSSISDVGELNVEAIRLLNEQVQSLRELLTESFQQLKNQQDSVMRSLEAIDRRLDEHDISIKNQTQNSWKLEIAYGIDFGEVPILLSIANNWIVLMHRFDGSLNFNRTWIEYKTGFGEIGRGEFWLGNEKIHRLTNTNGTVYTLRIEVQLNLSGRFFYAEYATFSLDSESNKYAIRVSGFSGNAGDSLTNTSVASWFKYFYHGGMKFTTFDADNDKETDHNCAQHWGAGWWFNACWLTCLTCPDHNSYRWYTLHELSGGGNGELQAARMMIKSK